VQLIQRAWGIGQPDPEPAQLLQPGGSCGTAAHRRQMVIVSDIATEPFWDDLRDLARAAGVAACWSTPILARDGSLIGTFAMYHRTPRPPGV
jgi:GAF domain-containing protein